MKVLLITVEIRTTFKDNCSFTVDSSNGKVLVTEGKKIKIPTLGTFRLKEAIPNKLCLSDLYYI